MTLDNLLFFVLFLSLLPQQVAMRRAILVIYPEPKQETDPSHFSPVPSAVLLVLVGRGGWIEGK